MTKPKFEEDQLVKVKESGYVAKVYSRIPEADGGYCYKLLYPPIDYDWFREEELEAVNEQ